MEYIRKNFYTFNCMKSIVKNVAIITIFSCFTRFLGFLFRIFLSRAIGAEALGMYQVALSVFFILLTIVSSGFTLIISRMTAGYRVKSDKKAMASLVTTALFVGLIVSIVLCLIVLVFQNVFKLVFTDENCLNILIILLPSLVFSAIYSVFRGAMWGCDNYFGLCVSELVEQLVKIAVFVLILGYGMSAFQSACQVAWSFTTSCIVSAIFVVLLFFVYGGKLGKPTKIYKKLIKQSAPITGVRVLGSFTQPLIALILPARLIAAGYTKSQAMSIYGVAMGMTFPLLLLPGTLIGSLATALVPDIAMALEKQDHDHIQKRVQASVTFTLLVSFLVVPIFVAVGDKIGLFLYDNSFSGSLLQLSTWMMIPMSLTNISSAILNSVGYEVRSFVNYVIGDVFMFLCLLILPQFIGIHALIIGMGMSTIISSSLNFLMLKKKLHISVNYLPKLALLILLSLPAISLTSFVSALLAHVLPIVLDLLFSCVLGELTFILLCVIFNVVKISSVMSLLKEKFSKRKIKSLKKA